MRKVLIVEDQAEVRELVEVTLSQSNVRVLQAESGDDGVRLALAELPQLVLMDVMMPGEIDGWEAVRRIRGDERMRKATVLMLTARSQSSDFQQGREAGADGYITKPFSPLALIKKVDEVLG